MAFPTQVFQGRDLLVSLKANWLGRYRHNQLNFIISGLVTITIPIFQLLILFLSAPSAKILTSNFVCVKIKI